MHAEFGGFFKRLVVVAYPEQFLLSKSGNEEGIHSGREGFSSTEESLYEAGLSTSRFVHLQMGEKRCGGLLGIQQSNTEVISEARAEESQGKPEEFFDIWDLQGTALHAILIVVAQDSFQVINFWIIR